MLIDYEYNMYTYITLYDVMSYFTIVLTYIDVQLDVIVKYDWYCNEEQHGLIIGVIQIDMIMIMLM